MNQVFQNPQEQYDHHAQVIFRIRDQNGKPVRDSSIFFNSFGGDTDNKPGLLINELFEDKHVNNGAKHCTAFYLRLHKWNGKAKDWQDRLAQVNGIDLEIDVLDTETKRILFVPLRMRLPAFELEQWLQPHRTTIIDVELLRLPSEDTFALRRDAN